MYICMYVHIIIIIAYVRYISLVVGDKPPERVKSKQPNYLTLTKAAASKRYVTKSSRYSKRFVSQYIYVYVYDRLLLAVFRYIHIRTYVCSIVHKYLINKTLQYFL